MTNVQFLHPKFLLHEPAKGSERVKTRLEIPERAPDQLLFLLCRQPELTLAEVAQAIDRSVRAVERGAAKLRAEGRLRYLGPKKGGCWDVLQGAR